MSVVTFWDAFTNTVGPVLLAFAASYIWLGDTPMFRLSEGFAVGVISAESFLFFHRYIVTTLGPQILVTPTLIIPVIFGLLQFSRLTNYRWLARYPIALQAGIGVGLTFGASIRSYLIDYLAVPVTAVMKADPDPVSSVIALTAAMTVMTYYLYSAKFSELFYKKGSALSYVLRLGRIFMMFSFSYLYLDMYFNEGVMHIPLFYTKLIKRPLELFGIVKP